ncbi:hypothetical protein Tco_0787390 [Tanacetum coccineum]
MSKNENKGKVPTEMELVLEQTQQGTSYEVSVSAEGIEELKRNVRIKGEKKEALYTLRKKPEHQSDTKVFTMMMEILLEPTSNKLLVERFDTSAGNPVNEILLKLNLPDHRIPKPSVLGKPTPFSDSLERKSFSKTKSVPETNVSESLSKSVTSQSIPQTARQATSRNTDPRMSTSTGVIHRTNVSRPPLRITQMKDKVVPNNSQVKFKKTEVEDHHRISNKTKSVTACNDSLKSRTSNVNVVLATCGKCVFNLNHDACDSKF